MNGLSKITDKILNEARAEAAEKLAAADEKCAEITVEYSARAEEIKRGITARSKAQAEEMISRARSSGENVEKNMILSVRAELIDKAFAKAESEILAMPEEKYIDFLSSLLASTFACQLEDEKVNRELYGEEGDEVVEKYEVLLGAADKARIGEKLLPDVKRKLVGKDALDKFSMLVMAEDSANIEGGFVLRVGSMEINNSVKAIFGEIRPRLEAEVNKILFADKKDLKRG